MDRGGRTRDEGHTAKEHTAVCMHTHRHTHTCKTVDRPPFDLP